MAHAQCPNSGNTSTSATFCNQNALTIENNANGPTDGSPYPFQVTVSGMSGAVSSVNVTLNGYTVGSGTPPEDAELMLVSPGGQALTFFGGVCGGGASEPNGLKITLSDSGTGVPPNGSYTSACAATTYKPYVDYAETRGACPSSAFGNGAPSAAPCANNPSGSNTFTSVFTGATANGTWKIYAYDQSAGDAQSITSGIALSITTEVTESATTTNVGVSSNQAFTTSPGNAETYTATVTSGGNPVTEGDVAFYDNGNSIAGCAAVPVSNGVATCTTAFSSSSQEGNHSITATYTDAAANPKYETSNNNANPATVFVDNHTTGTSPSFCNAGKITVSSNGSTTPYPQHVFVTGLSGSLAGVTLTLNNITTSYGVKDWNVLLVGPDGKSFVPMADAGGYASESGLTLKLSDNGTTYLAPGSSNTAPSSSTTYLPTAYAAYTFPSPAPQSGYNYPYSVGTATFATTFAGENLDATQQSQQEWSLYISDQDGDSDVVNGGYCLTFLTNNNVATQTTVTASPNPAQTNTVVALTAHVVAGGTPVVGGSVKFESQGSANPLGTVPTDSNGNATFQYTPTSEGLYNITAMYEGAQGQYNESSGSATLQVDNPTTETNNGNNSYSFCNAGPITITSTSRTPQQYPSRVLVSNLAGTVAGVTLTLDNVTYSNSLDLAMLIAHDGTSNNLAYWGNIGSADRSFTNLNFTIEDGQPLLPPTVEPVSGTYAPTVYSGYTLTFPAPAPANPNLAGPAGSATLGSQFDNTNPDGYWSFYVIDDTAGGDTGSVGEHCVNLTINPPVLTVSKTHSGSFTQGDTADTYTITVANPSGPGSTAGTLTLTDTLPSGLTATALSETGHTGGGTGSDWTCTASSATCTRTTAMSPGESDTFTLTVSVGYGTATGTNAVTNSVSVSGGGISATQTATNPTTINEGAVQVTFGTNPSGLTYTVDGTPYTSQQTLSLTNGSQHTISTTTPQGSNGTRYTFQDWSSGPTPNSASETITISSTNGTASYLASFGVSYLLTTAANPTAGGTVGASPAGSGGYYAPGTQVTLTATPNSGYSFSNWTGTTASTSNPLMVTLNGPVSETANFTANPVPATVTNVSSTTANGSYGVNSPAIPVVVTFSKAVFVTGTPTLALNDGATATYASGSGTASLTFNYTIGSGQNTARLDEASTTALSLNGGAIVDGTGTAATLTLPAPGATGSLGANKQIAIDTTSPTVVSFSLDFGSQAYNLVGATRTTHLPWTVTAVTVVFSKPIAMATVNSLSGVTATALSGLNTTTLTWTINPLTNGTFSTSLAASGSNGITDADGNYLGGGTPFSENFSVLYGDFNGDGSVTSADMVAINAAAKSTYNQFADLNGDGVVSTADVSIDKTQQGSTQQ